MKIGVGYRRELAEWIAWEPVECLEITAEHFVGRGEETLAALAGQFSLYVHGLGLSLGTPGPLDAGRLRAFARVADIARAEWISEHVAFTRTEEGDLRHLNPLFPSRETAGLVADHAREVADVCGRPIILENITSHLRIEGDVSETDFLNEICERAGCGLLVDVTNLFINSRNHGFDPIAWLDEIETSRIQQLHIVGYSHSGGRYLDSHGEPIQEDLLALAREVIARANVQAIILERDEDFPGSDGMEAELAKLRRLRDGC
jgi:uncharacterized protein (UPF0276 family)